MSIEKIGIIIGISTLTICIIQIIVAIVLHYRSIKKSVLLNKESTEINKDLNDETIRTIKQLDWDSSDEKKVLSHIIYKVNFQDYFDEIDEKINELEKFINGQFCNIDTKTYRNISFEQGTFKNSVNGIIGGIRNGTVNSIIMEINDIINDVNESLVSGIQIKKVVDNLKKYDFTIRTFQKQIKIEFKDYQFSGSIGVDLNDLNRIKNEIEQIKSNWKKFESEVREYLDKRSS